MAEESVDTRLPAESTLVRIVMVGLHSGHSPIYQNWNLPAPEDRLGDGCLLLSPFDDIAVCGGRAGRAVGICDDAILPGSDPVRATSAKVSCIKGHLISPAISGRSWRIAQATSLNTISTFKNTQYVPLTSPLLSDRICEDSP